MITESMALEIARKAIEGKAETHPGWPVTVKLKKGRYTITFERINPPGLRAADYDAQVTIDAKTGEVLRILGAS